MVCMSTLEEGQSRTIRCVEWSPDGSLLASASFDGSVVVWQAQDVAFKSWEKIASLEGHDSEVKCVSWSSDGNFLATCGRDKKVWVWERLLGGDFECVAMLSGHSQDVKFVKWHPTANVLFSCSYDDSIKVWMDDNDDWYCTTTLPGHSSTVWGAALDATGSRLVSVSDDLSMILWESESPLNPSGAWRQVSRLAALHKNVIFTVDWSHHNSLIASGAGDNAIKLIAYSKTSDGTGLLKEAFHLPNAHDGDVNCVRWCPVGTANEIHEGEEGKANTQNQELLLSSGDDGLVKLWKYVQ